MLGLSPGLRPDHPLHGMLPGLGGLPLPHHGNLPLPPHPPSSGRPSPLHNMLPNMWPFIWNHISNLLPQLSITGLDPLSQQFSLRWKNHQSNLLTVFDHLLQTEAFCDVTLACDGGSIKCHKLILSACSTYFEKLFIENSCEHPIVFLKDVKCAQVRAILDYMYKGEVSVAQDELPDLLRIAELLRVKGMVEEDKLKGTADCQERDSQRSSSPGPAPTSTTSASINGDPDRDLPPTPRASNQLPPQPSAQPGPVAPNFRPFLTPPGQGSTPPFPMWPLPGLFPGAHSLFHPRDEHKEMSPGPDRNRSKMTSGSSSGKDVQLPPLIPRDPDKIGYERSNHNGEGDDPFHKPQPGVGSYPRQDKSPMGHPYMDAEISPGKLEGIAGYVPTQRLEWKRYKQYTRSDIMAAIEEVKKGMSALQASRKFGVPSRTLYDKVKKMGITTGRQQQRKHMPGNTTAYSAAFPGINMMSPLSRLPEGMTMENPYTDLMERMKVADERSDERSGRPEEGVDPTTRGPMPPFSILPPHMLNMMERIKSDEGNREGEAINLTGERERQKGMSEGSIPQSPSPSSGEMTSPVDRTTPPQESQRYEDRAVSPPMVKEQPDHQIDIRAQFLADLRRLNDHRPITETESGAQEEEDNEPKKKHLKVSEKINGTSETVKT